MPFLARLSFAISASNTSVPLGESFRAVRLSLEKARPTAQDLCRDGSLLPRSHSLLSEWPSFPWLTAQCAGQVSWGGGNGGKSRPAVPGRASALQERAGEGQKLAPALPVRCPPQRGSWRQEASVPGCTAGSRAARSDWGVWVTGGGGLQCLGLLTFLLRFRFS